MIPNDDKISNVQLGVFTYLSVIGVGVLILPSPLVRYSGNDAWILCIAAGLINLIFVYIMCNLGKRYSSYGLVGTLKFMFGKVLGTIIAIPVFIYFILISSFEIRIFAETTKMYLLNKTPLEYIILPLLFLAFILTRKGIEPISRFFELVAPIIFIVIVFIMIIMLPRSDYSNLRPFLNSPLKSYITGFPQSLFSYSGFELLLILFPYIREPKKACKTSMISLTLVNLFYAIIIIQCIARLGVEETKNLMYPTMSLIKSSDVPGAFIEGIEGLLMAQWVLFVFTTLVAYFYGAGVVCSDILKQREKNHILALLLPVIYIMALQGESIVDQSNLTNKILYFQYYTIIVLPVIMFIISKIKRRAAK